MINEDKLISQADTAVWVDGGYEAVPLSGPGRWMTFPDGTIIYTDDDTKLFAKNDESFTYGLMEAILAIEKLWAAGKTATEAFETLRGNVPVPVVSGDLSEIA
ncbi:hypothetical protein ACH47B_26390 [Rhodococcus sp. NPDC019627]|uniref:hypothetical protein n=1 Tax=unclassified Rhodococcus (in: high G+C Gram-positive bacteria) TaxID=192944 RepID=UPI0034112C44